MSKEIIHFAHANGFPAKTYSKIFSLLENEFEINYLERHAHNPIFPVTDGWQRLSDELREELIRRYDQPVIGIGHSLGGILHLLTAAENPELYRQIVLLDAPIISRLSSAGIKFLKLTKKMDKSPLVKTTRFRKSVWKNKAAALEHFRQKEKFSKFDADVLRDYVEYGTIKTEKGFELFFNPQIEAAIYATLPDFLPKLRGKLRIPVSYVGGTKSLEAKMARLNFMQKHFSIGFQFIEGSHLFPFEKPRETALTISYIIKKNRVVK